MKRTLLTLLLCAFIVPMYSQKIGTTQACQAAGLLCLGTGLYLLAKKNADTETALSKTVKYLTGGVLCCSGFCIIVASDAMGAFSDAQRTFIADQVRQGRMTNWGEFFKNGMNLKTL